MWPNVEDGPEDPTDELEVKHKEALDALQDMCRRDCNWQNGYYDPMGSTTLREALDVLVQAGRLEWVGETRHKFELAKDKEA